MCYVLCAKYVYVHMYTCNVCDDCKCNTVTVNKISTISITIDINSIGSVNTKWSCKTTRGRGYEQSASWRDGNITER